MKLLTCLSAAILTISLFAQQPPPTRSNNDYPLLDSRIVTISGVLRKNNIVLAGPTAGTPLPDGCEIEFKLEPGERALEARGKSPTRMSKDACELEMEIGRPPEDKIAPSAKNSKMAASEAVRAASPGLSSAYAVGWWTDPVEIWVHSEQVDISWTWTSPFACAYLNSYSRSVPAQFLGWSNVINYTYPIFTCSGGILPQSEVGAATASHWKNSVFPACLGGTVNVYYNPIRATGDNRGTLRGNMSWSISGPACQYLLSPNFQIVRTYN